MDKRIIAILTIVSVVSLALVNTTVFAYRWISGTINITGASAARGAACTGFYSASLQSGITAYLPNLGTNANAPTYGNNLITVTPGNEVCQWSTYSLYESIEVSIPVTVGSWYIQDFYAFGYNGTTGSPTVYVYFRVDDDAADGSLLTTAKLYIWKDSTRYDLDLLSSGEKTDAIPLSPRGALRLDLYIDAQYTGIVSFKVGVYVTQELEAPNIQKSP